MEFLRQGPSCCQGPSCRAAFYPDYRPGIKGRRRGLWGCHDQAKPGAPTGSRWSQGIHVDP